MVELISDKPIQPYGIPAMMLTLTGVQAASLKVEEMES